MTELRRAAVQLKKGQHGVVQIDLSADKYAAKRLFFVDYVDVSEGADGAKLVFGKVDPLAPPADGHLHFMIEVSFPYTHFCNQLYKSLLEPSEPGTPLFTEALAGSMKRNGYPEIKNLEFRPRVAEKKAFIRANAATMVVFEDDTAIDLVYLDAMALHLASKGRSINEISDVIRVAMAPNLLLYFTERVMKVAEELLRRTPELEREVPDDV